MHKILSHHNKRIDIKNENNHSLPFVISIPHSGLFITNEMNNHLKDHIILPNMDWYLPQLYSFLEELDYTVVINHISRYVIDPNRELTMIHGKEYTESLVYQKTTYGKDMYKTILSKNEINDRINRFYKLYHQTLEKIISEKLKYFDKVYFIDLHSFGQCLEADVILGNNEGKTMGDYRLKCLQRLFVEKGFTTALNQPFKGGYITKHYGQVIEKCESIQIELSYHSYIDQREFIEEELPAINKNVFNNCQNKLKDIFIQLKKEYLQWK